MIVIGMCLSFCGMLVSVGVGSSFVSGEGVWFSVVVRL